MTPGGITGTEQAGIYIPPVVEGFGGWRPNGDGGSVI